MDNEPYIPRLPRTHSHTQDVTKAYRKVVELFKQNMAKDSESDNSNDTGNLIIISQDLLILLLPHLPPADATTLFQLCLSSEVLNYKDNGVQKRGYKILGKLVDAGKVAVDAEHVLKALDELGDGLLPAAKKVSPNISVYLSLSLIYTSTRIDSNYFLE